MVAIYRKYQVRYLDQPATHYFYRQIEERDQIFWSSTTAFSTVPVRSTLSFRLIKNRFMSARVDNAAKRLLPCQYLLINPGQTYSVSIAEGEPAETFSIHFCPETVERVLSGLILNTSCSGSGYSGLRLIDRVQTLTPDILECLDKLEGECQTGNHPSLQSCVDELLARLILQQDVSRQASELVRAKRPSTRYSIFQRLHRARDHIHACPGEKITTSELADIAHMSKFHFQRRFYQLFHINAGEMIQQERMRYARRLLQRNEMSLGDVALEVGYAHHQAFTRAFGRITGLSPQAFRRKEHKLVSQL